VPSNEAAHASGFCVPVSRRAVLGGLSLLPLAAAVGGVGPASAETTYRYLTPHQAAVLDAATRRLIPGPDDCPLELASPGAHEANVVNFLDRMLSVFDVTPADVHAGGPWSNRAGGSEDFMAVFVPLNRAQTYAWQQRLTQLRSQYTSGIALLDLVYGQAASFTNLLFGHTIEAITATRNTAATRTWSGGSTSSSRATPSRGDTPPARSKRRNGTWSS
jgi:hypothetical protein